MKARFRRANALVTLDAAVRALDGTCPVAPLKGALLELTADPGRAADVSDVDILVPADRYDAADAALRSAGFRRVARDRDDRARTFVGQPVAVDLHRRLFKQGLFRVETEQLFARARLDEASLGAPVWLLDPRDAVAHAVGHAASGRVDSRMTRQLTSDVEALARAHTLEARAVAEHLGRTGLRRAARYALARLASPFARAVLRELAVDPLGRGLAGLAHALAGTQLPPARLAAQHVLNDTLPRGAVSLASHVIHGAHRRLVAGEPA